MTLSAIFCPADYMQSRKEISHLIQLPKLCANKKAKAFGDPTAGAFPQLAPAVLVLHVTVTAPEQTPRNCSGQQFLFQKLLAQCDTTLVWVGGALGGDLSQAPLQARLIQERSGCSGERWMVQGCRSHSLGTKGTCLPPWQI